MNNRVLMSLFSALALSACAAPLKHTYMPDGRLGYAIDCSGQGNSWVGCYQLAGELCGVSGYDIMQIASDEARISSSTPYASISNTVVTRTMVVACG